MRAIGVPLVLSFLLLACARVPVMKTERLSQEDRASIERIHRNPTAENYSKALARSLYREQYEYAVMHHSVSMGMTWVEVVAAINIPYATETLVTHTYTREQMVYDRVGFRKYGYFYVFLDNGVVTGWSGR